MNFTLVYVESTEASTSTACTNTLQITITSSLMKQCSVCESDRGNYKCPTCFVFYCSVNCCQKHREKKCGITKVKESTDEAASSSLDVEYLTDNTVPEERLQLLRSDEVLKDLLSNPHLRNVLKTVDNAPNPEEVMQKAMQEPLFVEFADACLKVVEPQDHPQADIPSNSATRI